MKYKFYSIIIPSYNRVDEVLECLESLRSINFDKEKFEVIVVDDGSTDSTIAFLKEYEQNVEFNFSYYTEANQGPGSARNMGMQNARGDFFMFIDSDVTVPQDWLTHINKELHQQEAQAFGGPDSYRDDFPPLLKAINYLMTAFITTVSFRGKKGKKLDKFYPRSFNMGLSRSLWEKIGGFRKLRFGEDVEYSNRIMKTGAKVIFIESALVYQKRQTNIKRFFRQVFNLGMARINLYKIDKSMLELRHIAPAIVTMIIFLVIIFAPFFESIYILFVTGLIASILLLLYSMIDSIKMYKEIKPALLLPFVASAQTIGYGLGFIYNFIRRIIMGKGE
jgi:GT2 family glycosyltransferase